MIANNAGLDVILEKYEESLRQLLLKCNEALAMIPDDFREQMEKKRLEKLGSKVPEAEKRKSILPQSRDEWWSTPLETESSEVWHHWTLPVETDLGWPEQLVAAVEAYKLEYGKRQAEI